MNLVYRNASRYDAASCRNSALPDPDAWTYHCSGAYPGSRLNRDGFHAEAEAWVRPIVIPGAQVRTLRDTYIRANRDGGEIVDPDVLPDPCVGSNRQAPWKFNANARL